MNLTEAFEVLAKGRKMDVGAITTRANGVQYQKQGDGKWVEYKKPQAQVAEKEPVATKQSSYEEDYKNVKFELFEGSEHDAYTAMALSGVPKHFDGVVKITSTKNYAFVNIDDDDLKMDRQIFFNQNYIENFSFNVKNKGKYSGSDIFNTQVQNTKKDNRIKEIRTVAGGSFFGKMNGYYTWLRLGYTPNKRKDKEYSEKANKELGTNITSITELMYSQEGRDWWKENGGQFEGTFDLSENSYSMKTLEEYVKNKNK
jgi:hypothetical protein